MGDYKPSLFGKWPEGLHSGVVRCMGSRTGGLCVTPDCTTCQLCDAGHIT